MIFAFPLFVYYMVQKVRKILYSFDTDYLISPVLEMSELPARGKNRRAPLHGLRVWGHQAASTQNREVATATPHAAEKNHSGCEWAA